jgi:two-component SAPR family response regulator
MQKEIKIRIRRVCFILFLGLFICHPDPVYSQIYGLGFYSHEVSKDSRTGLNLSPDRSFYLDDEFELSFDFGLRPNSTMYFGYVFRIITENNMNIDLIFNYNDSLTYFTLVAGQKLILRLPTDFTKLCNEWTEYHIKFNLQNRQVSFFSKDTVLTSEGINLKIHEKIKILFGASDIINFKTTDVPAMNIRNIKLLQKGKVRHHWPLDEAEGNSAKDIVGRENAMIRNPSWTKLNHSNWENIFQTELDGFAQVAFDEENEDVILIGDNKVIRFDLTSNLTTEFIPENKNTNLLSGRQAFFDQVSHRLYSYDIDFNSIAVFNFDSLHWRQNKITRNVNWTIYSHHNKFYRNTDSSLYIFGGYGQHQYKNKVQNLNLRTKELFTIKPSGDTFYPRYLGALGELNDTIYILGGYGSSSGEQILNPHTYNDLIAFSLKDNRFSKKFELKSPLEDLAFSNSMVIDPVKKAYYVLVFPIFKYEGYLQLMKGSLTDSDYSFMGSKIPYLFSDIKSYADLFFCRQSRKLITTTILTENGKSVLKIYSLLFPPGQQVVQSTVRKVLNWNLLGFLIVILAVCGVALFFIFRIRHNNKLNEVKDKEITSQNNETETEGTSGTIKPYSILFFGDFKVFNKSGTDITRKFTPLLKELFLLIWLHSLKNDTGISTEKIIEILWFDYTESSAHNNKAVNISKLKTILNEIGNCELSNKTGYWKIDFNDKYLRSDYSEFLKIVKSKAKLSKEQILNLITIIQKGTFLNNLSYDWLDEFKADITNDAVDHLIHSATGIEIGKEPEFIIHLADAVIKFDSVNEEAMLMKCKALILLGRHTIASDTYNKFCKEYKILYGSDFEKSFAYISGL